MSDDDAQFYFPSSPPAPPPPAPAPAPTGLRRVSGGFGAGPFGAMAFGSGGGIALSDAQQLTRNSILMRFTGPVPIFNPADVRDALYDRGYQLEAYTWPLGMAPPHVPRVVAVERSTAQSAVLYLDAVLDGPGVVYRVIGSPALLGPGSVSARSALFRSFGEGRAVREARSHTQSFDLANVQAGLAAPGEEQELGTLHTDADGDYANDGGLENLKKRVIRRVTTRRGAYLHAPDYGMRVPLKALITPALLRDLQAQAVAQVSSERGVTEVSVTCTVPSDAVVRLGLEVTAGALSFGVDVDLPIRPRE